MKTFTHHAIININYPQNKFFSVKTEKIIGKPINYNGLYICKRLQSSFPAVST